MSKSSADALMSVLNKGADRTYPCRAKKCEGGTMRRVSFTKESLHHVSISFRWKCDKCGKISSQGH